MARVLNIVQWNSQSLKPKLIDFDTLLSKEKVHIAIISETWLDSESALHISGYNIHRKDRLDSYGGVAIIVHKSVQSQVCSISGINTGIEAIHVRLLNCKHLDNIISIYCPSSVRTSQSDWENIFKISSKRTLIAGDFNGHHTNWSYKNDQRGIQLFDSALENGFISLNNGDPTRMKLVNNVLQKSSPDITFSSSDIAIDFKWKTINENLGSDHLIIKITINSTELSGVKEKLNFKKANWIRYKEDLIDSFFAFDSLSCSSTDIQNYYNYFLDVVNKSVYKNIPLLKVFTGPTNKFTPKHYWSPSLSKTIAERRLALSFFRKNPTPDNLTKLEDQIQKARKHTRQAKSSSWQNFCGSINECVSVSDMWRKMRWFRGYRQSKFIPSEDKQKQLLKSLTPDFVSNSSPIFSSSNSLLESVFTLQELEACLKKTDTAPGNDRITYSIIYNLPLPGKQFLLNIYNAIFTLGFVPNQWRTILIVPIPKIGTENNSEVKLRPISLISCICKIFHQMIGKRLEWYIEKHLILSSYTCGFRRAQSCLDCLTRLVSYIQVGFGKNCPTVSCFLDVENAYNNILVDKVVNILDELKVGKKVCAYLWCFLSDRRLMIRNDVENQISEIRHTNRGLAQGDPLSPLLFNIATFKLCHKISNVFLSQYADDFVLYVCHKNLSYCESQLQISLNEFTTMLNDIGLQLSPNKSKICIFSRGRRRKEVKLYIGNSLIPTEVTVRYLGLWLDTSLRWSKHVNEISEKSSKFLNLLKVLAGSGWGIHPKHLRTIYISLVRSRVDFGCFLYDNSAKSNLFKLDRIQNQALRIIGGYIKSTPIHVMESELCLPPLFLRRLYLAYKYCIKSMSWSNNITIDLLMDLSSDVYDRYWQRVRKPLLIPVFNECKNCEIYTSNPLELFKLDIWVSYIDINGLVKINLESMKGSKRCYDSTSLKSNIIAELATEYAGWIKVFTDGSKSNSGRGAAYFDISKNTAAMFKVKATVSIMTLELIAISEALNFIKGQEGRNFVIVTDSKSALQHMTRCASGYSRGVPIVYKILKLIYELVTKYNINLRLQWVPSHIGLKGNEEADRLAKLATKDGLDISILPNYTEVVTKFKNKCYFTFKEYFDERSKEKGIWFKTIQCQPPRIPWFYNSKLSRTYIVAIDRLRSGHYPSKKFGYLMNKIDSPNCEVCGMVEDVQHILAECKKYKRVREALVQKFHINTYDQGAFLSILAEPTSDTAKFMVENMILHQ